jgi:LPS sulfotransferase NodH
MGKCQSLWPRDLLVMRSSATRSRSLPQFIHVGPQRTGTTWLYEVLKEDVVFPRGTKETMFFDLYYRKGIDWYKHLFADSDNKKGPLVEIAPTYFHSDEARDRIRKHIPDCRILCTLRDPVERLYSLYKLMLEYGVTNLSFEQAVEQHSFMMLSSQYEYNISRWVEKFGRHNVTVFLFDDLQRDPVRYLQTICRHLGVETPQLSPERLRSTEKEAPARNYQVARLGLKLSKWFRGMGFYGAVNIARRIGIRDLFFGGGEELHPMAIQTRIRLRKLFFPEVERLERLLGRDLSSWKGTLESNGHG